MRFFLLVFATEFPYSCTYILRLERSSTVMVKRRSPTSSRRSDDYDYLDDFDRSINALAGYRSSESPEGSHESSVPLFSDSEDEFSTEYEQSYLAPRCEGIEPDDWSPRRVVTSHKPSPREEVSKGTTTTNPTSSHNQEIEGPHQSLQHANIHSMTLRRRPKTNHFEGESLSDDDSDSEQSCGTDTEYSTIQGSPGQSSSNQVVKKIKKTKKKKDVPKTTKKVQKKVSTKTKKKTTGNLKRKNRSLDVKRAYEKYLKLSAPTEIQRMAFFNDLFSSFSKNVSNLETTVSELENNFARSAMASNCNQETHRNLQNLIDSNNSQLIYSHGIPGIETFSNNSSTSKCDQFGITTANFNRQETNCVAACSQSDDYQDSCYEMQQDVEGNVPVSNYSVPLEPFEPDSVDDFGKPIISSIDISYLLQYFKHIEEENPTRPVRHLQNREQLTDVHYNCDELVDLHSDERLVDHFIRVAPSKRKMNGTKKNVAYKKNKDAIKRRKCDENHKKQIADYKEAIKQKELEYENNKNQLSFTTLDVHWIEAKCEELKENSSDSLNREKHELDVILYKLEAMKNVVSRAIHQMDEPCWIQEEMYLEMYYRTLKPKRQTSSTKK